MLDYESTSVPSGYVCKDCGATGVRLYRRDHIILQARWGLLCRSCALKEQKMTEPDHPAEYTVGWLVAAVPSEDEQTYWEVTYWENDPSPKHGVEWWNRLPKAQ